MVDDVHLLNIRGHADGLRSGAVNGEQSDNSFMDFTAVIDTAS